MRYFITGANRGIGLGLAEALARRGHTVVAAARDPDTAAALKRLEEEALGRLEIVELDVTDDESVARLSRTMGAGPVDVLINNAGRFSHVGPVGAFDYDGFVRDYDVNTLGPLRVVEALLPNLLAAEAKIICNITSNLGSLAQNVSGDHYAYRASKAALNMVTQSLAADLREDGMTVVLMHPGWVKTDMGGANAEITLEESVGGILRVLDTIDLEETGSYRAWDGTTLPW